VAAQFLGNFSGQMMGKDEVIEMSSFAITHASGLDNRLGAVRYLQLPLAQVETIEQRQFLTSFRIISIEV
jgi:hypothetical protein